MPNGGPPSGSPYSVRGTVKDDVGNLMSGVTVTATNMRTAETQNAVTNAIGEYLFECQSPNFASGYIDGDVIQCSCLYDTGSITIDIALPGSELLLCGSSIPMFARTKSRKRLRLRRL